MNLDVITVGEKSTADIVLIWFHGYGANNWGFEPFIKLLNLNLDGRLHVVMPNAPIDNGKRSWYPLPATDNGSVVEDDEGIMNSKKIIAEFTNRIKSISKFNRENLEPLVNELIKTNNTNFKGVGQPIRIALTGSKFGPGLYDIVIALGKEEVLKRLTKIIS